MNYEILSQKQIIKVTKKRYLAQYQISLFSVLNINIIF